MFQLSLRLKQAFQAHRERPALWVKNVTYTYEQLEGRASQLARPLQQLEKPNALLLVGKSFDGYASILACTLSKITYIPLNNTFPVEKIASIIRTSGCSTLLVDEESIDLLEYLLPLCDRKLKIIRSYDLSMDIHKDEIFKIGSRRCERTSVSNEQKFDNLQSSYVYLMFTSGSTGLPKGVPVNEQNLLNYLDGITSLYNFDHLDRHSQFFDFTFDLSVHDIFVCWTTGGCLYAATEFDKLLPTKFVNTHKLTVWFSTPSMVTFAKQAMGERFQFEKMPTLKHSLFCGEALTDSVVDDWSCLAENSTLDNLYGPTEATIAFTLFRVNRDDEEAHPIVPIGKPFGQNRCVILNDELLPVEFGEVGQLYLTGPQVVDGYWTDSDKTNQVFIEWSPCNDSVVQRLYKTGDLASSDSNGVIYFHGRIDHQVKLRGYRVEIQEIESLIRRFTGSDRIVVVPYPYGEKVCTGLTLCHNELGLSSQDLVELCRSALPTYMVPDTIAFLDNLPINSSGKLDRRAITELLKVNE
ncbi:AMP-binding protein [Vibrio sp. Isolate30]|uniref:AMP-binding protein n=1 Tax=Vibrio sp. Isolate30 TaxID=2908536 RepID=UPI001EFE61BA|nr:AMP-binding protein [Vibrio sp. Isolate30]